MNKATRADLLRERLKALRERPVSLARKGWTGFPNSNAPLGTVATKNHQVKWVREPDEKPSKEIGARNRREVSPLTKIAAKWRRTPS